MATSTGVDINSNIIRNNTYIRNNSNIRIAVSPTLIVSSPAASSAPTAAVKPKTATDSSTPLLTNPTCASTPMAVSREEQTFLSLIGPYPYDAPPGFHWVPNGWKLEKTEASYEQLFLEKVKSNP